jgi:hypothetical protein
VVGANAIGRDDGFPRVTPTSGIGRSATFDRTSHGDATPPFATVRIERFNLPPRSVKAMRQSSAISVVNGQAEHHPRSGGPGSGAWRRTRRSMRAQ